jgi:hypothetical protein
MEESSLKRVTFCDLWLICCQGRVWSRAKISNKNFQNRSTSDHKWFCLFRQYSSPVMLIWRTQSGCCDCTNQLSLRIFSNAYRLDLESFKSQFSKIHFEFSNIWFTISLIQYHFHFILKLRSSFSSFFHHIKVLS